MLSEEKIKVQLKQGEDSFTQFKRQIDRASDLSKEMVAFANARGGNIFVGIDEDENGSGVVVGVNNQKVLNNLISNASTENCVPPIFPIIQNFLIDEKIVVVIYIEEGIQKPYRTKSGGYLTKSGADKRAISQEELSRLLQNTGMFHIEEIAIRDTLIERDVEKWSFNSFFEKQYEQSISEYIENKHQSLEQVFENLNLGKSSQLNLVGLLLFSNEPQRFRPSFVVKAVSFFGNNIEDTRYLSSEDIGGTLEAQYKNALNFLKSNLLKTQQTESFNSLGRLEIAEITLEEILMNALLHRDYNKLSAIKLLVFKDRVEIISPGHLVNHLSIENIKNGNSIARNPILLSFASRLLPYRGLGSGIRRALKAHPNTEFINDCENQEFKVILLRDETPKQ